MIHKVKRVLTAVVVIGSVFGVVGLAVGVVTSSVVNFALFSAVEAWVVCRRFCGGSRRLRRLKW